MATGRLFLAVGDNLEPCRLENTYYPVVRKLENTGFFESARDSNGSLDSGAAQVCVAATRTSKQLFSLVELDCDGLEGIYPLEAGEARIDVLDITSRVGNHHAACDLFDRTSQCRMKDIIELLAGGRLIASFEEMLLEIVSEGWKKVSPFPRPLS